MYRTGQVRENTNRADKILAGILAEYSFCLHIMQFNTVEVSYQKVKVRSSVLSQLYKRHRNVTKPKSPSAWELWSVLSSHIFCLWLLLWLIWCVWASALCFLFRFVSHERAPMLGPGVKSPETLPVGEPSRCHAPSDRADIRWLRGDRGLQVSSHLISSEGTCLDVCFSFSYGHWDTLRDHSLYYDRNRHKLRFSQNHWQHLSQYCKKKLPASPGLSVHTVSLNLLY